MNEHEARALADAHLPYIGLLCKWRWGSQWRDYLGEMYLQAIKRLGWFDASKNCSVKTYLYRYLAQDVIRAQWPRRRHKMPPPKMLRIDGGFEPAGETRDLARECDAHAMAERVRAAADRGNRRMATLAHHYLSEMSQADIAVMDHVSPSRVSQVITGELARLREEVE